MTRCNKIFKQNIFKKWYFTLSQPLRLYQGERGKKVKKKKKRSVQLAEFLSLRDF